MDVAPPGLTISSVTVGCPSALVDAERLLGIFAQQGFRLVQEIHGSDVALLGMCGCLDEDTTESFRILRQLIQAKRAGALRAIVMAGRLPERFRNGERAEDAIDAQVTLGRAAEIAASLRRRLASHQGPQARTAWRPPHNAGRSPVVDSQRLALTPSHYAYLKITEGCARACSFCAIPHRLGPLVSRPLEEVVREAQALVAERGSRELLLVGHETSAYGLDRYGSPRIAELLKAVATVPGLRWIRLLACHPAGLTEELLSTLRRRSTIYRYLDCPIEHSEDRMLRLMRREITGAALRARIIRLRQTVPGIALRTSVIVGFPGETDEDAKGLLRFLEEMRFDRLTASPYTPEPGTEAARLSDQVPETVVEERYAEVVRLQTRIAAEQEAELINQIVEVHLDAPAEAPGCWWGRTAADRPEVDRSLLVRGVDLAAGQFLQVKACGIREGTLIGEAIPGSQERMP